MGEFEQWGSIGALRPKSEAEACDTLLGLVRGRFASFYDQPFVIRTDFDATICQATNRADAQYMHTLREGGGVGIDAELLVRVLGLDLELGADLREAQGRAALLELALAEQLLDPLDAGEHGALTGEVVDAAEAGVDRHGSGVWLDECRANGRGSGTRDRRSSRAG